MKKVALVFVLAVLVPSLVLAWLAVRSLRDQQFLLERQQSLLDQHVTDTLAQNISDYLTQRQREFSAQVENMAAAGDARTLASRFDDELRKHWPLAEVGFCVTASGKILSPLPNARPAAQMFRLDNSSFLGNREPVEVYLTANNANASGVNNANSSSLNFSRGQANQSSLAQNDSYANSSAQLPEQQRRESKPVEQFGAINSSVPSQSLVPSGSAGVGFGGSGGSGANNFTRNVPSPASSAVNVSPQAFAIYDSAASNFNIQTSQQKRSALSNPSGATASPALSDSISTVRQQEKQELATTKELNIPAAEVAAVPQQAQQAPALDNDDNSAQKDFPVQQFQNTLNYKAAVSRKVSPQSQAYQIVDKAKEEAAAEDGQNNLSKVVPAEAEFRQLIGDQTDGMLARFLQNKLKLMCWHRLSTDRI